MDDEELLFDQFWQASSLGRLNIRDFAQGLNSFDSEDKTLALEYPEKATSLPKPRTAVNKVAQKRHSDRTFTKTPLSQKELGTVLSSFYAWNGLEHRGFPSAGASYTTEVFGIAFNTQGLSGNVFYYDAEAHGVVTLPQTAPLWRESNKLLNIEIEGIPQLLLFFVIFPERATAKYGERGGRFALLEAGAAMQQLALQIADSSLKGVAAGGTFDSAWKQKLGLENTSAQIALGYLVGK